MFQEISELRLAQADGGLPAVSPRSARWSIAKFPAVRDGAGKFCRGRGGTHRVSCNHRRLWCRGLGASPFYCVSGRAARRRIIGQGDVRYGGVPRVLLIHAQIQQ